ncbi:MAG: hypothetical protein KGI33_03345 [Thaumarchaeota archaeon]|nr:hypothetical protein [Nitrososphaerota archaeon]
MQKKGKGHGQEVLRLYQQLEAMCGSILQVDPIIQSVAVINVNGRIVEKNSRQFFAQKFPDRTSNLFCMHHALQGSTGWAFDGGCGPARFHMPERPGITTLTFPAGSNLVLVTAEGSHSSLELARRIGYVIDAYTRQDPIR